MSMIIHHSLDKLNISNKTKIYFTKREYNKILDDPVILNLEDNQNIQAQTNWWELNFDRKKVLPIELKEFFEAIISHRSEYVSTNYVDIKMIFYAWYNSQFDSLNFSLISNQWQKLPFGAQINIVTSLDKVIEEYYQNDVAKNFLSLDTRLLLNPELEEEEDDIEYTVNVWKILLPLSKA